MSYISVSVIDRRCVLPPEPSKQNCSSTYLFNILKVHTLQLRQHDRATVLTRCW